jgi:inner membrane protein involved in colicin E2 resistance
MTFFAPVSLLFFFAVLVIVGIRERTDLHPMNYFFLAAGCFAFQLLFAYLVDLVPLTLAFCLAAAVSLALVTGYLWLATTRKFAVISAFAQFAYMVLFSYSFFFDGLTGITITVGAIITLALLMAFTARVKWDAALTSRATPPPMPQPIA